MRSKIIPADAEILRTYDEIREFSRRILPRRILLPANRGAAGHGEDLGV